MWKKKLFVQWKGLTYFFKKCANCRFFFHAFQSAFKSLKETLFNGRDSTFQYIFINMLHHPLNKSRLTTHILLIFFHIKNCAENISCARFEIY